MTKIHMNSGSQDNKTLCGKSTNENTETVENSKELYAKVTCNNCKRIAGIK